MLIFGMILIFVGAGVALYGNHLNNDLDSQFEAIIDGRVNPGDFMLYFGLFIAVAGMLCVVLLIAGKVSEALTAKTVGTRSEQTDNTEYVRWCRSCGKRLDVKDAFCFQCGAKQDYQSNYLCKQCATVLEPNMKYCPKCGRERDYGNI